MSFSRVSRTRCSVTPSMFGLSKIRPQRQGGGKDRLHSYRPDTSAGHNVAAMRFDTIGASLGQNAIDTAAVIEKIVTGGTLATVTATSPELLQWLHCAHQRHRHGRFERDTRYHAGECHAVHICERSRSGRASRRDWQDCGADQRGQLRRVGRRQAPLAGRSVRCSPGFAERIQS